MKTAPADLTGSCSVMVSTSPTSECDPHNARMQRFTRHCIKCGHWCCLQQSGLCSVQEQLRKEKLLAEERQLTFRPSINHYYHTSRPRLCLSNPGPYLAHVQHRALICRESLLRAEAKAEVGDICR